MQEQVSRWVVGSLDSFGRARDSLVEASFLGAFGSPLLQAMMGLRASDAPPRRHPGTEPEHREFVAREMARLRERIADGGAREAAIRAMLYVRAPERATDERNFNMLRQLRAENDGTTTLAEFKELVRDQVQMLRIDTAAAIAAIPAMLQREPDLIDFARSGLRRVVLAAGDLGEEAAARFDELLVMFETPATAGPAAPGEAVTSDEPAKPETTTVSRRAPAQRRPIGGHKRATAG